MAVDKKIVEAQIKALGIKKPPKEVKYLPETMIPGEIILGICSGLIGMKVWICAITDKRVLMLNKTMFSGLGRHEIPISQIKSVTSNEGMGSGELIFDSGGQVEKLKTITPKENATKMAAIVSGLLLKRDGEGSVGQPSESVASQLERLAGLLEKGVLTEDEFAAQKAKLLGP